MRHFTESELRSLSRYVKSPGEPSPAFVPPGEKPSFPFVVFAP